MQNDPKINSTGFMCKHFSKGTAAAIIAVQRLPLKEIVLLGFDAVLSGKRENFRSFFGVGRLRPKEAWHNFHVEGILLETFFAEHGVERISDTEWIEERS